MLILSLSSCLTTVSEEPIVYDKPVAPVLPSINWVDVPGYYGIDDTTSEFDDLLIFIEEYEYYLIKVRETFNKYDQIE